MLALVLLACKPAPPAFCEGEVAYTFAPGPDAELDAWPDDHWTVADPSTPTGLRLHLSPAEHSALAEFPANYQDWFTHLSTLDGFGLSAGIFLRFSAPLPGSALDPSRIHVVSLGAEGPQDHPVEVLTTDYGRTLLLRPRRALPEATEVVVVLETDPSAADCVRPSPALRELVSPDTQLPRGEDAPALSARYVAALAELGLSPEQVGAMTLFTTQTATRLSRQVAEHIRGLTPALEAPASCVEEGAWRRCDAGLEALDFRGPERVVEGWDAQPQAGYTLPVRIWLPPTAQPGPYPVIVCGHGLGGDVDDCDVLVPEAAELGVAVVALDAVEHGMHPARTPMELDLLAPLMIFAIRVNPPGINGLQLRDNFRQSAWDKLQLLRALEVGLDLDGDGAADLDGERVVYAGVSLGAIMAAEPLALSAVPQAAWTAVGGARITQIIQDSPEFSVLIDLMAPSNMDEGDVDRAFPLLQTMVDPGDPAVWGPRVLEDRVFEDGSRPHYAALMALNDTIVPNTTNSLYVAALGLPGVGQEVWPMEGVSFAPGSVSGNLDGVTAGVVQLAAVQHGGVWESAEHANVHDSDQGFASLRAFLLPALEGETPVLLDPSVE